MLVSLVAAAAITWGSLRVLTSGRVRVPLDQPTDRSLHVVPVPRVGGVAVMLGALPCIGLTGGTFGVFALCALALALVSLAEDVRGVSIWLRLASHLAVAVPMVFLLLPESTAVARMLAVLALGWMTNLYNFMDGSDGLAGGMGAFGFGWYGIAAHLHGDASLAFASFVVAACAAVFVRFNFHPARVFLGDVGSIPLGLLAGAFGLYGVTSGLWPVWFPVLVFSPFVVDATATLIERAARLEKIWLPHRSHYYQRLVRAGVGHRRTALGEYAVMFACGLSAVIALDVTPAAQVSVLTVWALTYFALAYAIGKRWRSFGRKSNAA